MSCLLLSGCVFLPSQAAALPALQSSDQLQLGTQLTLNSAPAQLMEEIYLSKREAEDGSEPEPEPESEPEAED